MESDKHYKENFEALDTAEMEIKTEQAAAPKDGEEPGTEEQRQQLLRKARYTILQRTFFAPEEAALH